MKINFCQVSFHVNILANALANVFVYKRKEHVLVFAPVQISVLTGKKVASVEITYASALVPVLKRTWNVTLIFAAVVIVTIHIMNAPIQA